MKHICKSSNSHTAQPEESMFRPWRSCLTTLKAIGKVFSSHAGNGWRKYNIRESKPAPLAPSFAPYLPSRDSRNNPFFLVMLLFLIASTAASSAWGGTRWEVSNSGTTQILRGMWIAPDKTLFAVGDAGTTLKTTNSQWGPLTSGVTANLFDVWGSTSSNVVASGQGVVLHYNGATWTDITPFATTSFIVPAWMSPNGNSVFVFTRSAPFGTLSHYNVTTGQWNPASKALFSPVIAFCGVDNNVTAVDANGAIKSYDNSLVETIVHTPTNIFTAFQAVWMNPANCNEAFAADTSGQIFRFNGTVWVNMNAGITDSLFGMSGTTGSNVYAVGVNPAGTAGVVWHYDGTTWAQETIPAVPGLIDVAVGSVDALGEAGTIMFGFGAVDATPTSIINVGFSATTNDPISTFNGELFKPLSPDINLGGPMPLVFQRYYAAFLRRSFVLGDLGNNWRHNFDTRLFISGNTSKYVSWKGRVTNFIKNLGTGIWVQQDNLDTPYKLNKPAGQNAVLFDPQDNLIYTFDFVTNSLIAGKLATVEDGKGNVHTVTYNAAGQIQTVSDGLGRTLTFTHNADAIPKISVVSDGTRSILFQYTDPLDTENLTQFKDVLGGFTAYTYKDTSGTADHALMSQWMLPRLNVPFTQTFNATGQVATQTNANGNTTSLAYGVPAAGQTTITGPLGNSRVHTHTATGELANSTDQTGKSAIIGSDATGRRNAITDRLGDTTSMTYHAPSGKLASVTHADGTTESFAYTPRVVAGNTVFDLTGVTHADATTETLVYDAFGNLTSRTDQLSNTSTATYNGLGQVLTATNKLLGVTTNTFNADGTLATSMDPAGNTTTLGYDALKRPNLITHADTTTRGIIYDVANHPLTTTNENGNTTTITYDANGNLATVQDPLGQTTTLAYDGNDRLISATDPLGGISSMTYHPLGGIGTVTDANGNVTTFGYNALGRLTSLTDALGNVRSRTYDAEKIIASTTDPLLNTTNFVSDKLGRITQTTSPLGNINKVSYDPVGRIATMTDGLNQVTTLSRDAQGRITGISLPGGAISATITRNALGEPLSITDPNGNSWQRGYDSSGRLTSSTDPLMQAKSTSYDNRNRPSTITFPGALGTQTLTYDGVGNLTGSSYSDGTAFGFTYDANNRLTATNNGGVTPNNMTRAYDAAGRISNSNGIAITRDAGGRILTMTLAAGKTVTYAYDANNHVTSVTDWAGGITTFTYDNAGRLTNITRPNGVNTTNTWDNDSRLTGISESTIPSISSISLTRDAKGQITAATRTVPTVSTASGVANSANTFDVASQIASNTYDARGRQTAAGGDSFVWDGATRLTGYTVGGTTVANTYDALGYRTRRTVGAVTSDFVWNGALGIASISIERRGGADFRYFIHTPGGALLYSIDAANARSFYHFDEMGNTTFISNDAGATIGSYAYTPFGELITSTGGLDNPFTWQGQNGLMDEGNGLYYVRARFYDAKTGRFISRDANKTIDPRGMNAYQYAYNNPLRYVDINGREPTSKELQQHLDSLTLSDLKPGGIKFLNGSESEGNGLEFSDAALAMLDRQSVAKWAATTKFALKGEFSFPVIDTSGIDLSSCGETLDDIVKRRDKAAAELAAAKKAALIPLVRLGTDFLSETEKAAIVNASGNIKKATAALADAKAALNKKLGLRSVVGDIQGVLCIG